MPSYDWETHGAFAWPERFPHWAHGVAQWTQQSNVAWAPPSLPGWPTNRPATPRVFVSHKQQDRDEALRIAYLATQAGFEFWLDVLDPNLQNLQTWLGQTQLPASTQGVAIAAVIEMGLINSSHVIAVMTPRTKPSRWVPYEYGRAKEGPSWASQAAAWAHPDPATLPLPEYLHLGPVAASESEVETWLRAEAATWYGGWGGPGHIPWTGPPTVPLP